MGLLRSEVMKKGTLVIPSHKARRMIDIIGRTGQVQITDMNEMSLRRQYKQYIQRIEEMERKLRFLFDLIINLSDVEISCGNVEEFMSYESSYQLDKVEASLNTIYQQFVRFSDNNNDLIAQRKTTLEEKHVIQLSIKYFQKAHRSKAEALLTVNDVSTQALLSEGNPSDDINVPSSSSNTHLTNISFSAIAGVVESVYQHSLDRLIFHTTRGNSYFFYEQIYDEMNGVSMEKPLPLSVFVVYHQGSPTSLMAEKLRNICHSFGCRLYDWETNTNECERRLIELSDKLCDKERAVYGYEAYFKNEISALLCVNKPTMNCLIEDWRLFCIKEKCIYTTLDMFEGEDVTLRATCWFPANYENNIRWLLTMESQTEQVSAFLLNDTKDIHDTPPTYIKTTPFTDIFQYMVDMYGVPRYREVNPALTCVITLPFLFGVMFGDVGHGISLLFFAFFLLYTHKTLSKQPDIPNTLAWSRYLILLMSIFAIFSGSLYNEFFSVGVSLFRSRWTLDKTTKLATFWVPSTSTPYPYGFDPKWRGAVNELNYVNSFKMKFSVIVAYIQMASGLLLKAVNCLHFEQYLELIFDFIPQLLLLTAFVGYMDFLIIYKWITPTQDNNKPSIINIMVKLCLFGELTDKEVMFTNHQALQYVLLYIMFASILAMLFGKVVCMYVFERLRARRRRIEGYYSPEVATQTLLQSIELASREQRQHESIDIEGGIHTYRQHTQTHNEVLLPTPSPPPPHIHTHTHTQQEVHTLTDQLVEQWMESVEFILSVVSNTASYLRLWALSLAHQQLSIILFDYTILTSLKQSNPLIMALMLFINVTLFTCITIVVMLGMELTECLLHSLRLQWVEFQSKFYKADGVKFTPFSFYKILNETSK